MRHIENMVLANDDIKPATSCRYVEDSCVAVSSEEHLQHLHQAMEETSVLKCMYEMNINKIAFLDVNFENCNGEYVTSIFRKPINLSRCLNSDRKWLEKQKLSVIRAYVSCAYRNCSSWPLFLRELTRVGQILIDNYFR